MTRVSPRGNRRPLDVLGRNDDTVAQYETMGKGLAQRPKVRKGIIFAILAGFARDKKPDDWLQAYRVDISADVI